MNLKTIKALSRGKIKLSEVKEPFIIMRSSTRMSFIEDMCSYVYVVVYSNKATQDQSLIDEIEIERNTALGIIRRCNMKPVAEDEQTILYETEGQPFLKKYGGLGLNTMFSTTGKINYRNVHFRIECGYCTENDRTDDCLEELQKMLEIAGWNIDVIRKPGVCPELSYGKSHLYCHPTDVSGNIDERMIKSVEKILKNGKSFKYRATDIYEKVYDFNKEQLEKYMREDNRNTIVQELLKAFKTSRKNLYKPIDDIIHLVAERTCVHTLAFNYTPTSIELKVIREIFELLCREGNISTSASRKNGTPCARTNTKSATETYQQPTLF